MSNLKSQAASGAVWAFVDRFSTMALQFVVNLVLARLLLPADFGAIGLIYIFLAVSQTLVDAGFASALIQQKNPTQTDYSTIFFWNLLLAVILYVALFFAAPIIAEFYKLPVLERIVRVIGLSLIINSLSIIQLNRLRKVLDFKKIAIINLSSYILAAAIGIILAYNGAGVWSLVVNTLANGLFIFITSWTLTRWTPSWVFSIESFKRLFSYGGFLLAANILQEICKNLQGIIIGRKFSATQMGLYSQAQKLDSVFSYSIPQVIIQVMFPVFASMQDNLEQLRSTALRIMGIIAYCIFPIMALLIIIAEPLISGLYGEIWLPSVPYFRILCVGGIFVCLQNVNYYVVASVGRSKALFYVSIYKWSFLIVALLVGMNFGMDGLLWGMVISSFNIFLTNAVLSSIHVRLKVGRQIMTLIPVLLITLCCFALTVAFGSFVSDSLPLIVLLFVAAYLLLSRLFRLKSASDTLDILSNLIKTKLNKTEK